MSLFNRLFRKPSAAPPLPPLHHRVLGTLAWDEHSEGWTGAIPGSSAELYVGGGSAHEYPSEALLALLEAPFLEFKQVSRAALAYLMANADLASWNAQAQAFRIEGLEAFAHYLSEGTYTVTFTNGEVEAIWKVHFKGLQPCGWGVDD